MNYPSDYLFTKEHEWVHFENEIAFIGLTELAKKELEEIKSIEIHKIGVSLNTDQVFGRITAKRYLCKLILPFPGKITEVNSSYCDNPEQFNSYYDKDHWIVKVEVKQPIDTSRLLTIDHYKSFKTQNFLHLVKYLLAVYLIFYPYFLSMWNKPGSIMEVVYKSL